MYYLRVISKHYSIPLSESCIRYFFDNEEALRRLDTLASFSDIANPLSTDYDVGMVSAERSIHRNPRQPFWNPREGLPGRIRTTRKPQHRITTKCPNGWNSRILQSVPYFTSQSQNSQDIITSNLHSALRFGKIAPTLQNYIMQKQGWDISIFEMVDCPNFGKYLSSLPFVKQVNVIKMTHNWQYNHSRAMLFKDRESQSCPMECNEIESTLHHLRYKS